MISKISISLVSSVPRFIQSGIVQTQQITSNFTGKLQELLNSEIGGLKDFKDCECMWVQSF